MFSGYYKLSITRKKYTYTFLTNNIKYYLYQGINIHVIAQFIKFIYQKWYFVTDRILPDISNLHAQNWMIPFWLYDHLQILSHLS